MAKTSPTESLTTEIIKSHNHQGKTATQWFEHFLDDNMASFSHKLNTPWDEPTNTHLFELGRLYAQQIIAQPFADILGETYQALATNYGRKSLGQYFTPHEVAQALQRVLLIEKMRRKTSLLSNQCL